MKSLLVHVGRTKRFALDSVSDRIHLLCVFHHLSRILTCLRARDASALVFCWLVFGSDGRVAASLDQELRAARSRDVCEGRRYSVQSSRNTLEHQSQFAEIWGIRASEQ